MEKLAYSVPEVAKMLSIGRNSAYELVNRSDFPKIKLNNRLIVPADALKAWLQRESEGDNPQ